MTVSRPLWRYDHRAEEEPDVIQAERATPRMPLIPKTTAISLCASVALTLILFVAGYMLFHGYFDQGHFEIRQIEWSPSKQVAVLAERWDEHSLGGLMYFVIIDDHLPTPEELKHEFHSDAPVFAAMSDRLRLRWDGPKKLSVENMGSYLDESFIENEKHQSGDVAIVYSNIAPQAAQTYRPR